MPTGTSHADEHERIPESFNREGVLHEQVGRTRGKGISRHQHLAAGQTIAPAGALGPLGIGIHHVPVPILCTLLNGPESGNERAAPHDVRLLVGGNDVAEGVDAAPSTI